MNRYERLTVENLEDRLAVVTDVVAILADEMPSIPESDYNDEIKPLVGAMSVSTIFLARQMIRKYEEELQRRVPITIVSEIVGPNGRPINLKGGPS